MDSFVNTLRVFNLELKFIKRQYVNFRRNKVR